MSFALRCSVLFKSTQITQALQGALSTNTPTPCQTDLHWQSAILSRECRDPGPVFKELADEYFKPQTDFLNHILSKITNRPATDHAVLFAGISILGLVETCGLYRHYVEAVSPGLLAHGEKDDWFARQITRTIIEAASA